MVRYFKCPCQRPWLKLGSDEKGDRMSARAAGVSGSVWYALLKTSWQIVPLIRLPCTVHDPLKCRSNNQQRKNLNSYICMRSVHQLTHSNVPRLSWRVTNQFPYWCRNYIPNLETSTFLALSSNRRLFQDWPYILNSIAQPWGYHQYLQGCVVLRRPAGVVWLLENQVSDIKCSCECLQNAQVLSWSTVGRSEDRKTL